MQQKFGLNQVKDRILILSPIVQGRLDSELKVEDFQAIEHLGQGAFGKVFKTKHKKSGAIMALTQMEKQQIKEQGMVKQIQTEVKVMYNLNHPNIIKLYNHFEEENFIYLMIEYAGGGQLYQKLKKEKRFDENTVKRYMADIILAVEYLHCQNPPIIHRDIKPENLILDDAGRVKLVDFGWSNFKSIKRTTYCGTLDYLAPEMILEQGHDEKLDIWGLGVLAFEFLTGKAPFAPKFDGPGGQQIEQNRARVLLEENILKVRLDYPSDFPQLAKDLVNSFLKREPNQRKTLIEAKRHPWFFLEKEGMNIFDMDPWKNASSPSSLLAANTPYVLQPTQINPLRLEGGFSSQFIADFANRLHPELVKSILKAIQNNAAGAVAGASNAAAAGTTANSNVKQAGSSTGNSNSTTNGPPVPAGKPTSVASASQQGSSSNSAAVAEEIEMLKRKHEKSQGTIQELQKQLGDSQVLVKVKEEECKSLKENISLVKSTTNVSELTAGESRRMQLQKEEIEKLKSEKLALQEKSNALESSVNVLQNELKRSQDSKKDFEKHKAEKAELLSRVRKLQEEQEQMCAKYEEEKQKKDQEFSVVQYRLAQYEKVKAGGASSISGGIVEMNRELMSVVEEMKKQFVLTKKQIEINESYATMERDLNKLKVEKKTLEEDLRSQIQDDFEDRIAQLELANKQKLQQMKDSCDAQLEEAAKKIEALKDELSKESQLASEVESLRKRLDLAQGTINDLRSEADNSRKVKVALEKRTKEAEEQNQDLQQMLKQYRNNQPKK